MVRCVEIRTYQLKPGARAEFHRIVIEQSLPMLRRWNVDVVASRASLHDDYSYTLIRAYTDLRGREASQDAFYGSDEWKQGPRDAVMRLIAVYTTVVIELDDATIDGLRDIPVAP